MSGEIIGSQETDGEANLTFKTERDSEKHTERVREIVSKRDRNSEGKRDRAS